MFAKLVAVVVALGACGCTLLALRQSRLQVASEIAQAQIRINQEDERLWVLRARIAERVTPEQVEQMADAVGPLRPLVPPVLIEAQTRVAEEVPATPRRARPDRAVDNQSSRIPGQGPRVAQRERR